MRRTLTSFDGTEQCVAEFAEPDRYRELFSAFDDGASAVRGSGLSYCLASAASGVRTVSTKQFDRILAFDRERKLVTVEAGMTVGALSDFAVVQGCYFPVLPGHPSITIGGCAGFNVHGKTQHNVGHFSDHVEALTLYHPDHGELHCDANERPDLFEMTIGAMGLTGCIISLTLRLQPLAGNAVRRTVHPVANLHDAVERMRQLADADALYSWNDLNRRGDRFGSGVVYEERFENADVRSSVKYRSLDASRRRALRAPVWNSLTVGAVNTLYPLKESMRRNVVRSVHDAAFPINGNELYFSLFGSRGFREYQLIIADDAWPDAVVDIERVLARSARPCTLGSCKFFKGRARYLWFKGDGICLTIDTPAGPEGVDLFRALDRVALDYKACVNLSKDSRLDSSTVDALFPDYNTFRSELEAFDPKRRFDTALRRRLDL